MFILYPLQKQFPTFQFVLYLINVVNPGSILRNPSAMEGLAATLPTEKTRSPVVALSAANPAIGPVLGLFQKHKFYFFILH